MLSPLELRHLLCQRISFCMSVSKKSATCELSFHQLLIIVEAPWSQTVLKVGKQVKVARSEVRAVRRMVKQLPVEMPQQCWSVSSCMWTHIVMEKHDSYTGWEHSTAFVLNAVHFWHYCGALFMNSTISTPFLSQKTVAISFLVDSVCLNFFTLFGECVCIHCFDCCLVLTFTNETHLSSPVSVWLRSMSPFLQYRCKKSRITKSILCILCAPMGIFGTHLAQNLG
jgi:hypothetical protein